MRHETLKILWVLVLSSSLISCHTITIQPEKLSSSLIKTPDYEKSHPFFLGGLIGEAQVPVDEICKGKEVSQMQSQTTFLDGLWPFLISMGVATLGGLVLGYSLNENYKTLKDENWEDELNLDETLAGLTGFILASSLAGLIYTPKTAKVWCGESLDDGLDGETKEGSGESLDDDLDGETKEGI